MFVQINTFTQEEFDEIKSKLLSFSILKDEKSEDWNGVNYPYLTPDFCHWLELDTGESPQFIVDAIHKINATTSIVIEEDQYPPLKIISEWEYRQKLGDEDYRQILAAYRENLTYRRKHIVAPKVDKIIDHLLKKRYESWRYAIDHSAELSQDYLRHIKLSADYTQLQKVYTRAIAFSDFLQNGQTSRYYWYSAINLAERGVSFETIVC